MTDDAAKSPYVTNVTDQTFEAEVLSRSHERPVVVDFWATWCQPCLMLAPILERLADEYEGRFQLVKAETSEAPGAAEQFNVSSIPALFAVVDGEVVDMLVGGLPEPQLRDWLDRIVDLSALTEARRLEESSPGGGRSRLSRGACEAGRSGARDDRFGSRSFSSRGSRGSGVHSRTTRSPRLPRA